jgi:hypothetical protein
MTTPNVRCTCTGTCHPETRMSHPQLVSLAYADHRRWAFYTIGAMMCAFDTGVVHGPELPTLSFRLGSGRVNVKAASAPITERILAATDHIGRGRLPAKCPHGGPLCGACKVNGYCRQEA